jgi:hypothetical protein
MEEGVPGQGAVQILGKRSTDVLEEFGIRQE